MISRYPGSGAGGSSGSAFFCMEPKILLERDRADGRRAERDRCGGGCCGGSAGMTTPGMIVDVGANRAEVLNGQIYW